MTVQKEPASGQKAPDERQSGYGPPVKNAEEAAWCGLMAIQGVAAHLWWAAFKSCLRECGYEVKKIEGVENAER